MDADFIAFDYGRNACLVVLVERGPWADSVEQHLERLKERLYHCLEGALDGDLAVHFPDSPCRKVILRVDSYDVPRHALHSFMEWFSEHARNLPDLSPATSDWVDSFDFELTYAD